ncbi:MAG: peptidylprolyl isomerase [Oligoflexia bacterium]|nr:peptidylprolyl isomerase [Oligoflexia bacterium]
MKILIVFCISLTPLAAFSEVIEGVAAIVNNSIITKIDLAKYRQQLKQGSIVDDLFGNSTEDLLKNDKLLLKQLMDEKIVDSEVKKQSLFVTMERVEQEINSIQSRNAISREQLKEALKKEGTSFSEYQNFIKHRLERQAVIEKAITSKIKISDDDVMSYYESKYKNSSAKGFEFKIAHILLRQGKRSDQEQQKRALEVISKLKSGESFESLAGQYSEDPNYNEGGLLGEFKTGEFLKPLEEAIIPLSPGEWTGPVKTKLGYHVLKLLGRKAIADPSFLAKKEMLRGELYQKAFIKQFQFWLEQKRQEAFIKVN